MNTRDIETWAGELTPRQRVAVVGGIILAIAFMYGSYVVVTAFAGGFVVYVTSELRHKLELRRLRKEYEDQLDYVYQQGGRDIVAKMAKTHEFRLKKK